MQGFSEDDFRKGVCLMQASNLKPAGSLSGNYGAKAVIYGPPGVGKTPMINTAPRPVLLATEPGLLSMKGSTVPTWQAFNGAAIHEFFEWFSKSKEVESFDTICIDSGSQLAEIILSEKLKTNKDGRKAFGEMSKTVMEYFDMLYFRMYKHVAVICKQTRIETGKQLVKTDGGGFSVESTFQTAPYFPGQVLNVEVPHRFDLILHINRITIPGQNKEVIGARAQGTSEFMARDRSGRLAEIEPPNLEEIFKKVTL